MQNRQLIKIRDLQQVNYILEPFDGVGAERRPGAPDDVLHNGVQAETKVVGAEGGQGGRQALYQFSLHCPIDLVA